MPLIYFAQRLERHKARLTEIILFKVRNYTNDIAIFFRYNDLSVIAQERANRFLESLLDLYHIRKHAEHTTEMNSIFIYLGEQIFTKYGYTVLKVSDGEGALKIYQEKKEKIDLVILDLIMPGMGGKKCLEGLLQINPDVKVVVASGYSPEGTVKSFLEGGAKHFISKPFNMKEMLQVVREVLDEGTHS